MPLVLNQRVMDNKYNYGKVTMAYHNRALNEWSYCIEWENGMTGSFSEHQIRVNNIRPFDPFAKTLELLGWTN